MVDAPPKALHPRRLTQGTTAIAGLLLLEPHRTPCFAIGRFQVCASAADVLRLEVDVAAIGERERCVARSEHAEITRQIRGTPPPIGNPR